MLASKFNGIADWHRSFSRPAMRLLDIKKRIAIESYTCDLRACGESSWSSIGPLSSARRSCSRKSNLGSRKLHECEVSAHLPRLRLDAKSKPGLTTIDSMLHHLLRRQSETGSKAPITLSGSPYTVRIVEPALDRKANPPFPEPRWPSSPAHLRMINARRSNPMGKRASTRSRVYAGTCRFPIWGWSLDSTRKRFRAGTLLRQARWAATPTSTART